MGRIQLYIIAGIFLFGALTAFYYNWRSGIEREALMEYNQVQLEQSIKDQKAMQDKLAAMDAKQKELETANAADKSAFKGKMNNITTEIESKETIDRPASDVLKKTVSKLKDAVK
jgi:hypothetical protein